jgi:hypothetical protein
MKKEVRDELKKVRIFDDVMTREQFDKVHSFLIRDKWGLSGGGTESIFWHMDGLEEEEYFHTTLMDEIVKPLTGETNVELLRCYVNGQTAGQSGMPHFDNDHPDARTFLFFPNPIWESWMLGQLCFYDYLGQEGQVGHGYQEQKEEPSAFPDDVQFAVSNDDVIVPKKQGPITIMKPGDGKPGWGVTLPNHMETVHMVNYKPNRAVYFPSRIVHHAMPPQRQFRGLRMSLAWKIKLL